MPSSPFKSIGVLNSPSKTKGTPAMSTSPSKGTAPTPISPAASFSTTNTPTKSIVTMNSPTKGTPATPKSATTGFFTMKSPTAGIATMPTSPTKSVATISSPALIPVPSIRITRATPSPTPSPTWTCCTCHTTHTITLQPGPHPLGTLSCTMCPHHPCRTCTTSGQVRAFLPIEEPAMVPCGEVSDTGMPLVAPATGIPFGIVCHECGVSWRAREFGKRFSKTLRKMPSVGLGVAVGRREVERRVRRVRSSFVVGKNGESGGKKGEMLENTGGDAGGDGEGRKMQAEYVAVRFSGIVCGCGGRMEIGEGFCFQIMGVEKEVVKEEMVKDKKMAKEETEKKEKKEKPKQEDESEKAFRELWKGKGWSMGWSTTKELKEKGHGTEVLKLMGGKVEHPNPLRACAVVDEKARQSWEEKCKAKGWI